MSMRHIDHRTWTSFPAAVVAVLLMLPSAAGAATESEPNDLLGQANPLGPNDTIAATIGFAGDRDWFQVTLNSPGRLQLSLLNPPADMRGQLELYNRNADWIQVYATAINDGDNLYLTYDVVEPGTYFIRLFEADSRVPQSGYTLQSRFTPVIDAWEPNNRIGQARLLSASPVTGFAFDRSDRDWYKVYAPSGSTLAFALQPPPAMRAQVELYSPDLAWMGVYSTAVNTGDSVRLEYPVTRPGMYYARVFDADGRSQTNSYSMAISGGTLGYIPPETPVTAETEPNDRLGDAQLFNLGAKVSGQIGSTADVDWYHVLPTQPGQLVLACTRSPLTLVLRIRLFDDSGNLLVDSRAGGPGQVFSLTHDLKTPGALYVAVDSLSEVSTVETYEFQAQLTPVLDAFEPNDAYGDAKLLTQLNRAEGYLFPAGDHDWFKVNVSSPTNLTVIMSQVSANITPHISIYDLSKRLLASGTGMAGTDYELTCDVPATGSYFIELSATGNGDEALSPYTLTIFGAAFTAYAPVARIESIVPGASVQGDTVQFRGSGLDVDGTISGYAWRSSIDGALSSQAQFSTAALSVGTHTIFFKVQDNSGLWSTEVANVLYVASAVTLEQESNDTLSRANEIALNRPVRGKINAIGDRDCFKVYIAQPGHVTFRFSNVPTNLLLQASCYNHTWDWLGIYQIAALEGDELSVSMDVTQKGFAYVMLQDNHGKANADLTYTLTVTNAVALDSYEENNVMYHATRLTSASVQALCFPANDRDWYSVWVPQDVWVTATVTPPKTLRPQVELYDANRNWLSIYATAPNNGDTITVSNRFAKSGLIFIRVFDASGQEDWAQPYTLTVSGAQPGYVPADPAVTTEREPNNEISDANRVVFGAPVSGTIGTGWDGDWYSAAMPTPGILRVSVSVSELLRGRVRVFRADAAQINDRTGTNPGDDLVLDTRITEPGTYYFLVDSTDLQTVPQPYQLTASAVPVVDGFEDNNHLQTAARLSQLNRIQAYLFDAGDLDWYQVSANAGATLRASVADVPTALRPWVGIYDRHGTLLASKQSSNDGQEVAVEQSVSETADYFLLVRDVNNNYSADPYTLVVTGAKFASYVPLAFIDSVTPNPAITGQGVTLMGHGTDQDGTIIGYEWRSSIDGVFSHSAVVSGKQDFSLGRHVITLKVKDNDQNWSPETATILYVGSTVPQELEPNNVAGDGTRLELDLLYAGGINPAGDQDWFRIYVPQAGRLIFDAINPSAINNQMRTQLEFYGRDIEWLARYVTAANALDPVRLTVDVKEPGEYYLRVLDANGKANGRYSLVAHLGPVQDAFEPNDTAREATPLAPNSRTEAFLFPAGDRDWYQVTVAQPGELRIALTNMPANLRGQIEIYSPNVDWLSVYRTANNDGEPVNLVYDLAAPGTYYLRVLDADGHANATDTYTLALSFTPVADVFEPNDDFRSAAQLAGSPITAYLFPANDKDFYKVYAVAGATLSASIDQVPANLQPELSLWNANCDRLTYASAAAPGQGVTVQWPNAAGYYYVAVRDSIGQRSPTGTYRLTIANADFTYVPPGVPSTAEAEPNNEFGAANLVAVGSGPITGRCGANNDHDWFRFAVDRPGVLSIALNAPADLLAQMRLYDGNVTRLAERVAENRGDSGRLDVPIRTAGTYYLELFDQTGAVSGNYQFTLTLDPAHDTHEPNDAFSQATSLAFGQPVQAAIFPAGDTDWYLLRVEEPGTVRFQVQNVPNAIQIGLAVYDGNNERVFYRERLNGGDSLDETWTAAVPGWYRVQLYDRNNDAYSTAAYGLVALFTPMRDTLEPNNHFGDATWITDSNQVAALIYSQGDINWYRFTASQASHLRIQVAQAEGIEPVIELFNDSNQRLNYVMASNAGDTLELRYDLTAPGVYYVAVSDRDNDEISQSPYVLTILGGDFAVNYPLAVIDGLAPNPVLLGQTVTLTGSGVDQDGTIIGYDWTSDRDGALGSGATLGTSQLSEGVHRIGLRVQDSAGYWSARAFRDLVVAPALQTEDEPNNDVEHAFPLPLNTWLTGRIAPAGDSDYYRIYVGTTGNLRLQVNAVPLTMRPQAQLLGPAGEWLALSLTANNDGDYLNYGIYVNPGWYVVRVFDAGGRSQLGTYALRCLFTPASDVAGPNDTVAQATPVPLNAGLMNAFICPAGDKDWYQVDLTTSGRLSVLATNVPSNQRLQLELYDVNLGWMGVYRSALNEGEPVPLVYDLERAGSYFVRILDLDGHGSTQPFGLRFDFTPVVDPYENNDEPGLATLLGNPTLYAYSFPAGDKDWYKVYCDSGAVLRLWVTNTPATSQYSINLYSPDQAWLGVRQGANNPGDAVYLEYTVPVAGLYFIQVIDESGLSQLTSYELTVSGARLGFVPAFNPVTTEVETNNTLGAANDIALSTWITGTIRPVGDVDWFRWYVNAPGFVRITHTDVSAPLLSELHVYDSSYRELASRRTTNPGETNVLDMTVNAAGYYYARLQDYDNNNASDTPYHLKIEHTPVVDTLEPNNDFASATRLGQATVNAFLFDSKDEDWFRVYVREPGTLALSLDTVPKELRPHLWIFDAGLNRLGDWVDTNPGVGGNDVLSCAVAGGGYYYIQVRDESGGVSANPYTLRISGADFSLAPRLQPVGDRTLYETLSYSIVLEASNPDSSQSLSYTAANLPPGATFDAPSRTFRWTPARGMAGTYPGVRFQVSNGAQSDSEDIVLTVLPFNHQPQLAWTGEQGYLSGGVVPDTGTTASTFVYRIVYSDADGDLPQANWPKVHILSNGVGVAGSPFPLIPVSDTSVLGGRVYTLSMKLAEGTNYTYCFQAFDARGTPAVGNTNLMAGPIVRSLVDTDGDGLPDWWEKQYFGDTASATPDADPDHDGFPNWAEYLAGTSPIDAGSFLGMSGVGVTPTGMIVTWSSAPGKYYQLERSTGLGAAFQPVGSHILATPPFNSFTDTTAVGTGPFFYRVRLE